MQRSTGRILTTHSTPSPTRPSTTSERSLDLHVAALNHAISDIPPEGVRLHLCWGNYEGPHIRDIPLERIIDIVLTAKVGAISFEAANPRHAHEWRVFEGLKLPDDKILIPGVLDSTTLCLRPRRYSSPTKPSVNPFASRYDHDERTASQQRTPRGDTAAAGHATPTLPASAG